MKFTGIMLFCEDIKRMTAFYRDVIGMEADEDQPFSPARFFRFHSTDGASLCLHSGTKPNGGRQKLMFQAADVAALIERIKQAKPGFRRPKPGQDGKVVFDFYDPERNRIQVYGYLK